MQHLMMPSTQPLYGEVIGFVVAVGMVALYRAVAHAVGDRADRWLDYPSVLDRVFDHHVSAVSCRVGRSPLVWLGRLLAPVEFGRLTVARAVHHATTGRTSGGYVDGSHTRLAVGLQTVLPSAVLVKLRDRLGGVALGAMFGIHAPDSNIVGAR